MMFGYDFFELRMTDEHGLAIIGWIGRWASAYTGLPGSLIYVRISR